MRRRQYGLLVLVAFLGGLLGGLVSTRFLSNGIAFAQREAWQTNQRQIYAKTIIAEEFFLHERKKTDPLDGEIPVPRAILTAEPDGNPKLVMQDSNGTPRFSIELSNKNGATLAILNEKGAHKALLSEKSLYGEEQSGSTLTLLDNNGAVRAQIGVQANSNPFVSLNDAFTKDKKTGRSIRLCLMGKDEASISLCGIEGSQRAKLAIDSNDTSLSLKDPNGETRAELGNTELAFGTDGSLRKRSSATNFQIEQRPPSSLVLYNENGNVLWSAP